jgi:hypothetical protein
MMVFDIIGLCTAVFLFFIMFLRRSIIKTDRVSYLLAANSFIAFTGASPIFMEMSINAIYGELHPNSSFDGRLCSFKSYVLYTIGCVYFFSFLLQSLFRFCRIVYPTRAILQSFRAYVILSVAQWILAAILLLPSFCLGHMSYLPADYHCQLAPTNLRGSLLGLLFLFLIPFISTLICYFYTLNYVRTKTTALTTINQRKNIRRDLIILSRLFFIFIFLTAEALPHVIIPIVYAITGYLPPWVVSFEWLLTLFSLTAACIIQMYVTPHLKKICQRTTHINPITGLHLAVHQQTRKTNTKI